MTNLPNSRTSLALGLCTCLVFATAPMLSPPLHAADDSTQQAAAPPAPAVTTAKVKAVTFTNATSFSGRVEAIQSVDLKARIQGYLKVKNFDEGSFVNEGDLLYEIDEAVYANALQQAEASLQVAKANQELAEKQFARQSTLSKQKVQTKAALDEYQAQLDVSKANTAQAIAKVDQAKLDLGYTKIHAPISGRVGRTSVSVGDLITPSSGTMVKLVQIDPVYVSFPVQQDTLLEVQKQQESDRAKVHIELTLADGSLYSHQGKISFIDVQALSSTDSILVRAKVPNPDHLLIDQGLVTVKVVDEENQKKLAIPVQAMLLDQEGSYVLTVDDKNIVQQKRIKTGQQQNGQLEVISGLEAEEQVVVEGIQKARPGTQVNPVLSDNAS